MSGQLGELVVSLSADIARFQSDMGKAVKSAESASKDMAASLDAIPAMFSKMGAAAAGVTAVLGGGKMFKDAISTTKEVASEVTKLTKVFGITAEEASVMRVALDDAFLTIDDAVGASDRLTRASLKNAEAFSKIGIDIKDSNGNLKDSLTVMMEVNDYLKTLKEGKDRDTVAMSLYGKGWRELSGILRLNSDGMKEAQQRAEELHLLFGDDKIAAVKKYKQSMKDIDDVFESIKVQLGTALIPELTNLAVALGESGTKAIGPFIQGMHSVQAEIYRMAMLADKAGGSATRLGFLMSGGKYTEAGRWWAEQNKLYEERYKENERQLTRLAMSEVGLDENGNPLAKPAPKKGGTGRAPDMSNNDEAQKRAEEYVSTWNKLQAKIREMNPDMTEYQKATQKVNEEYDALINKYPEHAQELEKNRKVMQSWVDLQYRQKDAISETSAYFKEYLRLVESQPQEHNAAGEMSMRWENELKWLKDNQPGRDAANLADQLATINKMLQDMPELAEQANRATYMLMKPGNDAAAQRGFEIQGINNAANGNDPYASLGLQYQKDSYAVTSRMEELQMIGELNDQQLKEYQQMKDKQEAIDRKYAADKKRLDKVTWEGAAASVANSLETIGNVLMQGNKKQFEAGKAMAIASAGISMVLGAIQAFTAMSGIPYVGPVLGAMAAAAVVASGTARIAQIESMQYEAREFGGPVTAGQSYIVGEKRPELFTPGVSGTITPYVPDGKGGGSPTIVYQISTGVSDTVRAEIMRMAPALTQMTVAAVNSNINSGGDLAYAVGRG